MRTAQRPRPVAGTRVGSAMAASLRGARARAPARRRRRYDAVRAPLRRPGSVPTPPPSCRQRPSAPAAPSGPRSVPAPGRHRPSSRLASSAQEQCSRPGKAAGTARSRCSGRRARCASAARRRRSHRPDRRRCTRCSRCRRPRRSSPPPPAAVPRANDPAAARVPGAARPARRRLLHPRGATVDRGQASRERTRIRTTPLVATAPALRLRQQLVDALDERSLGTLAHAAILPSARPGSQRRGGGCRRGGPAGRAAVIRAPCAPPATSS